MNYVTVVSGLPRSGTSLMMQMLTAGGVEPLTDAQRQPDADNPRGYFELEAVKRTRRDVSWLRDAPGRVVKVIHILLNDLPASHEYRVIMMHRPIEEVLRSQAAMLARSGKLPAAPPEKLAAMFQAQLAMVERTMATRSNLRVLIVQHADCLHRPAETAAALAAFLERPLDQAAMAAVVSMDLYRQRGAS